MSTLEMKWEITRKIDKLPEAKLSRILHLIAEEENNKPEIDWDITKNMDKLIQENMDLLKRLA